LALCAGLAGADSLQLRNGRHLQGKYIGGTSTAIGFMTGTSVEYFATTDILALMFENATDSSLGGIQQPKPMTGSSSRGPQRVTRARAPGTSTRFARRSNLRNLSPPASSSENHSLLLRSDMSLSDSSTDGEPEGGPGRGLTLADGFWPSSL
jgi:hypothetical protein